MSSQRYTGMIHAYARGRVRVCVCVCVGGGWGGGGGRGRGISFVCVWDNVYVCICHSRDSKKSLIASTDKNKVLKS